MEVGRIVARVEAATEDFERGMQGAQRTFEQTAQKMQATGARVSAALEKQYADHENDRRDDDDGLHITGFHRGGFAVNEMAQARRIAAGH